MSLDRKRWRLVAVSLLLPLLVAGRCGGGDGSGGSATRFEIRSSDPRCVPLPDVGGFPPDYAFVPGAGAAPTRLLAATATRANLVPLGIEVQPFREPSGSAVLELPADADGDGRQELFKSIGDVEVVSASLGLVAVSGSEAVLFVDPRAVALRSVMLAVPAGFDPATFVPFPGLPAPGSARLRTGVTTTACIQAGPDGLDSRGVRIDALPAAFQCNGPGSYPASFTAAVAVSGGRLFVALSNVGLDPGRENTQFLPGAVVVFELDAGATPPAVSPSLATPDGKPYVRTTGFNATGLTPFTTAGGRRLLLVTHTGAIGIRADDPNTDVLESGALPITDGVVDVIDVDALELVATVPLERANPAFGGLALDPSGRLALFGDVNRRWIYGLDLDVVAAAPAAGGPGLPASLPNAVVFDGLNPLLLPALAGGAPAVTCPGQVSGVAFADDGGAAYALETCDGVVAALDVDLAGNPSTSQLRGRIAFSSLSVATAPVRSDTLGRLRRPASLKVRPGRPGIDYAGPDVFFTIGEPEGFLCGVRIDAP